MLEQQMQQQLQGLLDNLVHPIELVVTTDEANPKSADMVELLREIEALHDKVSFRDDGSDERAPSFEIVRQGSPEIAVRFAAIPLGHEFTSLALALLHVGGHKPKITDEIAADVAALDEELHFETYMSLTCQNCPEVVQSLNIMSTLNPKITHVAIDGGLFQDEVSELGIQAVPTVYLNGEMFASGRMSVEDIVAKVDVDADEKAVERLGKLDPFDVLVVGGGPAGSSAAIYAARKGLRTGILAERFGGQVADTMGIENFPSVPYTEGPKMVAAMEEHVTSYDVEIIRGQKAGEITEAGDDGLITVTTESGAPLKARSVILATGADWRRLEVPGEEEYRTKGVTFCPHCDGPFFKGKDVAVIGGGNSGVEAAIDLAGVVKHVCVVEFADDLAADDVLQKKLRSLPNVDIHVGKQTTEIVGDGSNATGIIMKDRATGEDKQVDLSGIFVQIGLLPNTQWLEGSLKLSDHGEIEIDERCATSMKGVFAAGDCTTVPYKQIVISAGQGATAALSAFDHLIRN